MNLKQHLSCFFFLLCSLGLPAQNNQFVAGELLVQAQTGLKLERWLEKWNAQQPTTWQFSSGEIVAKPLNIWLLRFDEETTDSHALLRRVRSDKYIELAQFNHYVQLRGEPNDTRFEDQWQYQNTGQTGGNNDADIDAVEAWDLTTGGLTATGDTIVVAVLDNGADLDHPDFQRNRWVNYAEIPNNGIDDDENGYVDDYLGWNVIDDNDDVSGGTHGTAVAGIIGADGDNGIGVTGVNWYVKVMIIRNNFNTSEDKVISAYSYALEARQRYDASGGLEGAFVVATNASWGVDEGQPEDAPIWCSLYDTLGEAGIVSCGATANETWDVDEVGDLPTTCPSDYLIGVTNTNHFDQLNEMAAFGATSIDLGAPGAGAFNISLGGGYSAFAGTSSATPHVAGVVGLLYSLDCPALMALVQSDPAAAALLVREAILEGVDPVPSLAEVTVTKGRLNAFNSLNYLLERCSGCLPASSLQITDLTDTQAAINWVENDSLVSVDVRWRAVGTSVWTTVNAAESPLLLNNLAVCQSYEYQLQSNCVGDQVPFGASRFFTTDGCCDPPEDIIVGALTAATADINWSSVLAANGYQVRFRENGSSAWNILMTDGPMITLDGLATCTFYEYQVRTLCPGEVSDWSAMQSFLTGGCGACLGEEYCINLGVLSTDSEFIEEVAIGGFFTNQSEGDSEGYQDFGVLLDAIELQAGASYPIQLTPGYPGNDMFPQAWKIWIDLDQNGSFTTGEILVDTEASTEVANANLEIPASASLGSTRMRVLMQFNSTGGPCPFVNSFGEIEDYCVDILPAPCLLPDDLTVNETSFSAAEVVWEPVDNASGYIAEYRADNASEWLPATVVGTTATMMGLDSCLLYDFRLKTVCGGTEAIGYRQTSFETCSVNIQDVINNQIAWTMYPVPTSDQLFLQWQDVDVQPDFSVRLLDALGREVASRQWIGDAVLEWDISSLPAGIYQVVLYQEGQLWSQRRMVKE